MKKLPIDVLDRRMIGGLKAVAFDAVGTLIHPQPKAAEVYASVSQQFGSRLDAATIRQSFLLAFARQEQLDVASGWRTDETRELQRWRTIVSEVLWDVSDKDACFAALYEHFAQPANWRVEAGTAEILAELRQRDLTLALASNFDRRLRRVVAGMSELAPLNKIIISSEVGWRKPALEFFSAMCQAVHSAFDEVLYIGDDVVNDYEGALGAGCRAVLYDPLQQAARHCSRISSLSQLMSNSGSALEKPAG